MLKRLERCMWYLFVFAIPFEKRLIIGRWLPSHDLISFGHGALFSEWTSAFIYGSDVLLLALLGVRLVDLVRRRVRPRPDRTDLVLFLFIIVAGLSLTHASNLPVAWFRWFKLIELAGLYAYVKYRLDIKHVLQQSLEIFIASALVQALIGIGQALHQASLGLHWLGESPLQREAQGVAVFIVNSNKFLRAYGTTPHPNVLAFVLYVALMSCLYLAYQGESVYKKYLPWAYAVLLWALLLTFSRTIIAVWLGVTTLIVVGYPWLVAGARELKRYRWLTLGVLMVFTIIYFPQVKTRIHVSYDEEAVQERLTYNRIAGSATEAHPWLGLGMGQFVPAMIHKYPYHDLYLYQPVHNIYLLISSELGLVGLGLFVLFIIANVRIFYSQSALSRYDKLCVIMVFGGVLAMGLLDHFLWTLQQGSLLLWAILGLLPGL